MLCGLIMAGGKGTRFWPLSTEEKPKQFLKLIGERTMIQMTMDRMLPIIPIERIFVCTGNKYVDLVKEQLPNLPERNIIIEPEGRNTAPCIALSAFIIERYYKDSTMIVLPSDHLIKKENNFRDILLNGEEYLKINKNAILTLGMKPNRAEIGYGYIKFNKNNSIKINDNYIMRVDKFVEKPDLETAEKYLQTKEYLWNGGMFMWKTKTVLKQIAEFMPNTFEALKDLEAIDENKLKEYTEENYHKTEAISIDYGILEKSKDIYVVPSDIEWDDIGTWRAVERYRKKDYQDNIISDNVKVIESKSNMAINNKEKKLIMIGIEDTMTVETEDAIFIINKKYMDKLKDYQKVL